MEHNPTEPGNDAPRPPESTIAEGRLASAGGKVGHYRLLELIGSGGMGEVWRAEQAEPVRRTVALKLIKPGMDSREILARFDAERQALALMNHPYIAKIFETGTTPEGRPFFAMEYVQGLPIDEYCDRRKLTTVQRLRLFQEVCEGVQHAHQKAVIHRDLKPGNVLVADVDGRPSPRIIDFGLAKALTTALSGGSLFTAMGQLIGTPEFMSPEQAELTGEDVDTRTDVYSLGVILYKLLAGALPFDSDHLRKAGFDGIRRILQEHEPPRPSTRLTSLGESVGEIAARRQTDPRLLARELEGDLDWIVMRSLEKDRNRRYGSPHEMARDIQRHLDDKPVEARPPSTSYRLRKMVRRNRAAVTAVAVVFVALLLGVVGTTYGLLRALSAELEARVERDEARRQGEISAAVNDFLNRDLLAAVAPSAAKGRGKDVPMREVLDVAAERIARGGEPGGRFADKPDVEAAIRTTLGRTYQALGEYPAAEAHLLRALEIHRENPRADRIGLAYALANMADLAQLRGRYDESESYWQEAFAQGAETEAKDALFWSIRLARVYGQQGRTSEAETLLRQALQRGRDSLGEEHEMTLIAMSTLANFYQEIGSFGAAESLQVENLAIQSLHFGDENLSAVQAMNNLANIYASQGRLDEAMPLYARSLELKRKILGNSHPSTLNTMNNLAEVQEIRGNYALAEKLHREVLAGRVASLGADHSRSLQSRTRLAYVLAKLGRLDEAESTARQVVAASTRTLGPEHPTTISAEDVMGLILLASGRSVEAERLLRRLDETMKTEQAMDIYTRTLVGAHYGLSLAQLDRRAEAEAAWNAIADDLPAGEAETVDILAAVVGHYERWHAAEPAGRYDARADAWRARLKAARER